MSPATSVKNRSQCTIQATRNILSHAELSYSSLFFVGKKYCQFLKARPYKNQTDRQTDGLTSIRRFAGGARELGLRQDQCCPLHGEVTLAKTEKKNIRHNVRTMLSSKRTTL